MKIKSKIIISNIFMVGIPIICAATILSGLIDAVCKASSVGANVYLFGILTLVTNLFGVACLRIYIMLHATCQNCGKMQPRNANYCSACGVAIYQKCPECGIRISAKDAYCTGCGKKLRG